MSSLVNQPEKALKQFDCKYCQKKYSSQQALQAHVKNKHDDKLKSQCKIENKTDRGRPRGTTKNNYKNKSFEQYQQELQDKIYAYLGQLGEKHFVNQREESGQQDSEKRLNGQANYLENNVVRTPFESQFQVEQEIPRAQIQISQIKQEFNIFTSDLLAINGKLVQQRDKWEFKDPLEIQQCEDQQFSLIQINNVLRKGKEKGLQMKHPEFSVFLLWIAKICKANAWKEFYMILGHLIHEFNEYTRTKECLRNQATWKIFTNDYHQKIKQQVPVEMSKYMNIIQKDDLYNFLKLYYKWVMYFDVL